MLEPLPGPVKEMLKRGVAERVFPGGVLAIWHQEKIFLEALGWQEFFPRPLKATPETLYDLASLTKPLSTTLSIMRLLAEGKISLDNRLADFFLVPHWFSSVTIRMLLAHCGGFPGYRPYFARLITYPFERRLSILETWIIKEPLAYPPGKKHIYSDLGFFLLGRMVEKVSQKSLETYFEETISRLGISGSELLFRPLKKKIPTARLAATEACPWRGKLLKGEVHDENTWVIGGVSGQAGLFGTAEGVLKLLLILLRAYKGEEEKAFLSRSLLQEFWEWQSPSQATWALGFDRPSLKNSSAGERFSPRSLGHLGFTGPSFWLDPEKEIIVVFLTNRVHPRREPNKLKAFRPALHNLILKELGF